MKLAAQMHQLGMHDAAEKVLARAQRQAGHRTAALLSLMHQYQNQNQIDLAVQIARQLLRKGPSLNFSPYRYNNQENDGRSEAIQVLVRSGKLGEMIERAEAQLKSSPRSLELHQTLLDYYKAAGDKNKLKDTAERMAKVRPDDGKVQFQIAQQLQQIGEFAASAERYKAALRKEPMLFAYRYWEIQQVFDQARKSEELIQLFDEIDIKGLGGNYWAFMNILQPLFSQDRTRAQGLKLFKKVWDAFPQERAQMMGYLYQNELWQTPEIYDYARQAVIPKGDDPVEPWRACDDVISYGGDGRVTGVVTRLLEAARKQNRLTPLTREIEQMVAKRPEWSGGKALLAVLNLQRGKTAEARRMWRELLDDKKTPMPMWPRFILGQEIEEYESMRDLALETYEGAIEETLDDGNMQFSYSPVRRLVHLYQDMGRKAEARALMLKCIRQVGNDYDAGYAAYRRIYDTSEVANTLCEMGYPVDAVRMCSEVLEDTETIEAAVNWNGPWMKQHAEQSLKRALKGLKSATLADAVHDLLAPRSLTQPSPPKRGEGKGEGGAPVLDLLLLVQPRELPKARLTSMLEQALREAAKKPELRKEVQATLAKLAVDYSGDLSVQIAVALEALEEDRVDAGSPALERASPAVDRLCKLVESLPLEKLPNGKRANSRQRAEAVRQIGLWLVARQCLRRPALRAVGEMLGGRAVEAGRRQVEPHYALAMLREWGQIELDRGDPKAAQKRWAEMLDTIVPPPTPAKRAAQTPKPSAPAVPAVQKVGSATHIAPGLPGGIGVPPASRGLYGTGVVRIYDEMLAAAPPVAPVPPGRVQATTPPLVPSLTNQQFEQVSQVATLAAEQKMYALSMRAVREALRGGPPVGGSANIGRSRVVFVGGGGMTVADNNNQDNVSVAQHLSELVPQWRRGGVPAADIYAVLADIVLPESRPAEVFLYTPATEADPSQPGNSVGQLLAETAVQAGRLDDLRRRVAARKDKPLGELNARVLLAQAAWAAGDEDRFGELLKEFGQRLQKDSLRHTAALICQVAAPALAKPKLTTTAWPVLERAAKNLLGAGADGPAMNTMLYLARHDFEHGKTKEGRTRLKEVTAVALRTLLKNGGNSYQIQQMQRMVQEYIRAGLLSEALDLFGMAVDLPKEQRADSPRRPV